MSCYNSTCHKGDPKEKKMDLKVYRILIKIMLHASFYKLLYNLYVCLITFILSLEGAMLNDYFRITGKFKICHRKDVK